MRAGPDRKVVFALVAIAALCVIGLGATLYRGKVAQLSRLHDELEDKRNKLASLHDKLTRQPELEAKFTGLQARLSVLEPGLPSSSYMPTFLRQIEVLAVATNNHIIMIRPKESTEIKSKNVAINNETGEVVAAPAPGADKKAPSASSSGDKGPPKLPYDRMDIEVKVRGTYWTVLDFLDELQKFPKMIAVNDISFTPERTGASQGTGADLSATLALTAVIAKGGKG
jgi:Tfp pilus assembly protein PilO